MTFLASASDRLRQAAGLADVLNAAYEAFEGMRLSFRAHEDPAGSLFAAFVMVAASAADGRDAVGFAPSMPSRRGGTAAPGDGAPGGGSAERAAGDAAGLSQLLVSCLARAAGAASDAGDQRACEQAARCAGEIYDLLGGADR